MGRRQLTESTLVIATHNKGKLVEIADLMRPFGVACVSAGDKGVSEPEETGTTFEANAELKALHSARATGRHRHWKTILLPSRCRPVAPGNTRPSSRH